LGIPTKFLSDSQDKSLNSIFCQPLKISASSRRSSLHWKSRYYLLLKLTLGVPAPTGPQEGRLLAPLR
jgi:hypothetical protein